MFKSSQRTDIQIKNCQIESKMSAKQCYLLIQGSQETLCSAASHLKCPDTMHWKFKSSPVPQIPRKPLQVANPRDPLLTQGSGTFCVLVTFLSDGIHSSNMAVSLWPGPPPDLKMEMLNFTEFISDAADPFKGRYRITGPTGLVEGLSFNKQRQLCRLQISHCFFYLPHSYNEIKIINSNEPVLLSLMDRTVSDLPTKLT
jgi:hypothetical protein